LPLGFGTRKPSPVIASRCIFDIVHLVWSSLERHIDGPCPPTDTRESLGVSDYRRLCSKKSNGTRVHERPLLRRCMQIFLLPSRASPDVGNMNHAAMKGHCLITGNPSPCAILQIQTKPDAFPFISPFNFFIDRSHPTCAKKASRLSKRGD